MWLIFVAQLEAERPGAENVQASVHLVIQCASPLLLAQGNSSDKVALGSSLASSSSSSVTSSPSAPSSPLAMQPVQVVMLGGKRYLVVALGASTPAFVANHEGDEDIQHGDENNVPPEPAAEPIAEAPAPAPPAAQNNNNDGRQPLTILEVLSMLARLSFMGNIRPSGNIAVFANKYYPNSLPVLSGRRLVPCRPCDCDCCCHFRVCFILLPPDTFAYNIAYTRVQIIYRLPAPQRRRLRPNANNANNNDANVNDAAVAANGEGIHGQQQQGSPPTVMQEVTKILVSFFTSLLPHVEFAHPDVAAAAVAAAAGPAVPAENPAR